MKNACIIQIFGLPLQPKQKTRFDMYSFPTSIAQEQAIENMVNSKHFGGFPYKVEDGGTYHGKHFVILSIELPNGTLREALRPDGSADHYFWGVKGFEEWHRLFYGE